MDVFFLGIGGTLMGNLAVLARERGYRVRGADSGVYPPMSDVLAEAGIEVHEGWDPAFLKPRPDLVVLGNAGLPRGHPAVEQVLDEGIPFVSGAEFLGRDVLAGRWVLAVAGTHGKTTTTSMLAWILERAGVDPGYLVGGVPLDLARSARLGGGRFFVVEADEYDCSYFDRRSKFVHYRPRTLILNNLEYDHADIFPDLKAIQDQFHNLLRTVPAGGRIVAPQDDDALDEVLARGCWTPVDRVASLRPKRGRRPRKHEQDTGKVWRASPHADHDGRFTVLVETVVRLARSRTRTADGRRQPLHVVVMSNGSFGGLPGRLREALGGDRTGRVTVAGREGERPATHYRSDRIYERDGGWRFATREGEELGPFPDRGTAEDALARFLREKLGSTVA